MQFMSESFGWADHVVLAMVPFGIITIMVSALRVGGPSYFKSLVGRAKEGPAVVEKELMSSTSTEVCELWNGHEVVRCIGSAPIAEFICLLPESGVTTDIQVEAMPFDKVKNEYLAENEPLGTLLRKAMSLNPSVSTEQDRERSSHSKNTPKARIIITRNPRKSSPNITLNSHNITSRAELRTAAILSLLLQLGLVAYAGCSVYHPALGFLKDGNPVAWYAFPFYSAGTLLLDGCLFVCAHVVGSQTVVKKFRPSKGSVARLVWLQRAKTVSNQVFDSFAVYSKSPRPFITISERKLKATNPPPPPLYQKQKPESATEGFIKLKTILGFVFSLCGYIMQLFGQRGLHWRDLAQLADWQGPASAEAVALARSIEATMNLMFKGSDQINFTWSLAARGGELIYFRLNRLEGKWNAHADELEAALSMWLFSMNELEKKEEANHQYIVGDGKDDKSLRVRGSPLKPGLRVLGSYTRSLHRDLSWWMPTKTAKIEILSRLTNLPECGITADKVRNENHRVVGTGRSEIGRWRYGVKELPEFTINTERLGNGRNGSYEKSDGSGSGSGGEEGILQTSSATEDNYSNHDFLTAEFYGPLKLLYAQDIFSSFFRVAAMTLKDPLEGTMGTRPKHDSTADTSWKSFVLHNHQLSKLARDIESTGLGSLSDVYLSIIPALSLENKLLGASVIIDLSREKA
ncbi:hypothetical protein CSIM01_08170 [Colletotrichum simmondsii]|uniref:Uncharacterized protein n=1 Tax=Colletotrichum simmondsii TaxID=703756 RepID=A0A135SPU9_9PEZI|nr:hypothetical protein CSIM01_08170 [Colletotrichum simmondsii]